MISPNTRFEQTSFQGPPNPGNSSFSSYPTNSRLYQEGASVLNGGQFVTSQYNGLASNGIVQNGSQYLKTAPVQAMQATGYGMVGQSTIIPNQSTIIPNQSVVYQNGAMMQTQNVGYQSVVRERMVPVTQYVPVTNYVPVYDIEPVPVTVSVPVQQQIVERIVQVPVPYYVYPEQKQQVVVQQHRQEQVKTYAAPPPPPKEEVRVETVERVVQREDPMVQTAKRSIQTRSSIPPPAPPARKIGGCCAPWLWGLLGLLALAGLITGLVLATKGSSSQSSVAAATPVSAVNGTVTPGPIIPVANTTTNTTTNTTVRPGVVAPIPANGTNINPVPVIPITPVQPAVNNYVQPIPANTTLAQGVTTPTIVPPSAVNPIVLNQTANINYQPTPVSPMSIAPVSIGATQVTDLVPMTNYTVPLTNGSYIPAVPINSLPISGTNSSLWLSWQNPQSSNVTLVTNSTSGFYVSNTTIATDNSSILNTTTHAAVTRHKLHKLTP